MKTRFITGSLIAAVFIAVLLLSLAVHSVVFDMFVLAIMLMAAVEMSKALRHRFAAPFDALLLLGAFLGYIVFFLLHFFDKGEMAVIGFFGVMLAMFLAAVVWASFDKNKNSQNVMTTAFVLIYPITVFVFMLSLNYLDDRFRSAGLLLLFLVAPFTDVFAYLVGSRLKGPKLCPKISPKKTISGAIGGLLGGITAGLIVFGMIESGVFDWLGLAPLGRGYLSHMIFVGFLGSIFTQAGDLTASYMKRKVNIKDYGSLLPGHGGVMDRVDGMMFAAFLINFYMATLQMLA